MPTYCGVCLSEEYTAVDVTDDGTRFAVCSSGFHAEPRVWEPPARSPAQRRRSGEGIGAELGVWDKLLECVPEGDFVPYGDVEDAFAERFPQELKTLIERFGHRWRDPRYPSNRFSASVYLAARLAELTAEGSVEHRTGPAEGPWAYNGTYEWWRQR